ncbi:hypothetical protein FACS189440_05220 [Bacteroidia bacterium]|nr:hypothetical protein FACS189440_05220 [Bacteroidia bacterium]
MTNRNYWAVGCNRGGNDDVSQEFIDEGKWFDGYAANEDERNRNILEQINIGDILLMKSSFTKGTNHDITCTRLKAFGKIFAKEDYYSFKVEWIDNNLSEDFEGISYRKTIEIMRNDTMLQFVQEKIQNIEMKADIQNKVKLLEKSKNMILTGAPGVGKTYTTAEIAVAVCDGIDKLPNNRKELMLRYKELVESGQVAFTTFHQSLDYEEFVEGLKPKCNEESEGKIIYSVEPGIFKKICQRAKEKSSMNSLDDAIEKLKEECSDEKNVVKAKTVTGAEFSILYNDGNSFYIIPNNTKSQTIGSGIPINIESIKKIYECSNIYDIFKHPYSIQKDYPNIHYPGYGVGILKYLEEKYHVPKYTSDYSEKNYVLIIDEINRGNISKIFGELITLLEKDKRLGEKNEIKVALPYSPEPFGVPSNLYIIGTMNTADRSIGQIDYALRRRFAFYPLRADETLITDPTAKTTFEKIKKLIENRINPDLDADDIMIGHSYFMDDFDFNLKYQIIPLLLEYDKDGLLTLNDDERKSLKNEQIPEIKND